LAPILAIVKGILLRSTGSSLLEDYSTGTLDGAAFQKSQALRDDKLRAINQKRSIRNVVLLIHHFAPIVLL
jgi:hypothetical protein